MKKTPEQRSKLKLVGSDPKSEKLTLIPNTPVLKANKEEKISAKTIEPQVEEILNTESSDTTPETSWGSSKKSIPIGWFILATLIILGVCTWASLALIKPDTQKETHPTATPHPTDTPELNPVNILEEEREAKELLAHMQSAVTAYLAASTPQDLIPHVRHPERVAPLIETYYQHYPLTPQTFKSFEDIKPMALAGKSFVFTTIRLASDKTHSILIEQTSPDTFKVDWESDICHLPMPWPQYTQQRPTQPVNMRVFVTLDNFYAYEFKDESLYQSYKITTLNQDKHLFAYALRNSATNIDILKNIQKNSNNGGSSNPMILTIRFPENSTSKNLVHIDGLASPRWIYTSPPPTP